MKSIRRPTSFWRRWGLRALGAALLLAVTAELLARFALGLGDPPLMMTDPQIEYLFQPSRSYRRFGNELSFNSFSMRSEEFSKTKSRPDELRVLVLGDSVVHGGAWVDQSQLGTELLKRRLQQHLQGSRPVVVGNAAAPSWGPPNLLAYVRRFGLLDADLVILVLGSEDYGDAPEFRPLSVEAPATSPHFALQEALPRYVPQFIAYFRAGQVETPQSDPTPHGIEVSMTGLRDLVDAIAQQEIPIVAVMHMELLEILNEKPKAGYDAIRRMLENRRVPIVELGPLMKQTMGREKERVFRDYVHLNAAGHEVLADAMFDWIVEHEIARTN